MFRRRRKRFPNNAAFLIAGAAMGGIAALLYARKPGVELRRDIKDEVDNTLNQIRRTAVDLKGSTIRTASDFIDRAAEMVNLSKDYVTGSYKFTAGSVVNEILHLRTAINAAVDAYKNYNEHPITERQPRVNNVFTTTEVPVNDEELPKFEGMGRRQE